MVSSGISGVVIASVMKLTLESGVNDPCLHWLLFALTGHYLLAKSYKSSS